jgi:uncharacterized protein
MKTQDLYPRYLQPRIREALFDSPVVLIHGPRQCGKTTLTQLVGGELGYTYITFDNDLQRAAAQSDPVGYVADLPDRTVLDEVQRVPELFTSLKMTVDARRENGRFILTGSANVLLVPKLADSLAGRMEILRLHPLSQSELTGLRSSFIPRLFEGGFKAGRSGQRLGKALADRVTAVIQAWPARFWVLTGKCFGRIAPSLGGFWRLSSIRSYKDTQAGRRRLSLSAIFVIRTRLKWMWFWNPAAE